MNLTSIWKFFKQGKRDEIFRNNPKYKKFFNLIKKNDAKLSEDQMKRVTFERGFLYHMIKKFLRVLDTVPLKGIDGYPSTCLWKITYEADCRHNLHVVHTAIEQSYSVQNDTAWLLN